jgi:hypothetical protein
MPMTAILQAKSAEVIYAWDSWTLPLIIITLVRKCKFQW